MTDKKEEFRKRVYCFTLDIIRLVDTTKKDMSCAVICKQLIRSGTSVGANHSEAQAASSRKDFINFLHYSLKSANETVFWLSILRDSDKVSEEYVNKIIKEAK